MHSVADGARPSLRSLTLKGQSTLGPASPENWSVIDVRQVERVMTASMPNTCRAAGPRDLPLLMTAMKGGLHLSWAILVRKSVWAFNGVEGLA